MGAGDYLTVYWIPVVVILELYFLQMSSMRIKKSRKETPNRTTLTAVKKYLLKSMFRCCLVTTSKRSRDGLNKIDCSSKMASFIFDYEDPRVCQNYFNERSKSIRSKQTEVPI